MQPATLLSVKGLSKTFPGVRALSDVEFSVRAGEVHCLIGENGAGKSTLVKILAGVQVPDSGHITVGESEVFFETPLDAQKAGISCIFQELTVVGGLSVAENIVLGDEPSLYGFFDQSAARKLARTVLDEIGFTELIETRLCKDLSPAEKQAVMIAKALRQNSKIIIMDEPTSPLEEAEVRKLFATISHLKKAGTGIVYVSHKMREIDELGDRITVFKDGYQVGTLNRGEADTERLVNLMVGRKLADLFPEKSRVPRDVALSVSDLSGPSVRNINFEVRHGEVLGIAGLVGSGRTELLRSLFGAEPISQGKITLDGEVVPLNSVAQSINAGMALVPEERRSQGIIPVLTVAENSSIVWDEFPHRRLADGSRREAVTDVIKLLDVKTPSLAQIIQNLSGGNQQKVVVGKWLLADTKLMLLDEPTRGIDVGAKREIYQIINDFAAKGMAVILVSSELPELLGLADRILVMNSGTIVGELPGSATEEDVVALSMLHSEPILAATGNEK